MKSIKQGRANSLMSGIIGILFSIPFFIMGSFISRQNSMMGSMFGESSFSLMSIVPIIMGIIVLVASIFSIYSATRKNRFSEIDITDDCEEPDPLNQYFGQKGACEKTSGVPSDESAQPNRTCDMEYCPYCGAKIQPYYAFCADCGKKLPGK